ncbi:hypothetical protein QJS66_23190 [Kocuria rhizophila]|nr:hypothetical protein QJS66_23190 [Kocuria rhizophila]
MTAVTGRRMTETTARRRAGILPQDIPLDVHRGGHAWSRTVPRAGHPGGAAAHGHGPRRARHHRQAPARTGGRGGRAAPVPGPRAGTTARTWTASPSWAIWPAATACSSRRRVPRGRRSRGAACALREPCDARVSAAPVLRHGGRRDHHTPGSRALHHLHPLPWTPGAVARGRRRGHQR